MIKINFPEKSQLTIRSREEYLKDKQVHEDVRFYEYLDELIEKLGEQIKDNAWDGLKYATLWIDEKICKCHNKTLIWSYELCQMMIESYGYKSAIINNALGNKFLKVYLDDTTDEEIENEISECKRQYIKTCIEVLGLLSIPIIFIIMTILSKF